MKNKLLVLLLVIAPSIGLASQEDETGKQCQRLGANFPGLEHPYVESMSNVMLLEMAKDSSFDFEAAQAQGYVLEPRLTQAIKALHAQKYRSHAIAAADDATRKMAHLLKGSHTDDHPRENFYATCNFYWALTSADSLQNKNALSTLAKVKADADRKIAAIPSKSARQVSASPSRQAEHFAVTLNSCDVRQKVGTASPFAEPKPSPDTKFLVLDASFKNTDSEGRLPDVGSIVINHNGKDYRFNSLEPIFEQGFGPSPFLVNPLMTFRTKLVYRIPLDVKGEVVWQPGRKKGAISLSCGVI